MVQVPHVSAATTPAKKKKTEKKKEGTWSPEDRLCPDNLSPIAEQASCGPETKPPHTYVEKTADLPVSPTVPPDLEGDAPNDSGTDGKVEVVKTPPHQGVMKESDKPSEMSEVINRLNAIVDGA